MVLGKVGTGIFQAVDIEGEKNVKQGITVIQKLIIIMEPTGVV